MESKRVAVTLTNGRSHLVDAPASVSPEDVEEGAVGICYPRRGSRPPSGVARRRGRLAQLRQRSRMGSPGVGRRDHAGGASCRRSRRTSTRSLTDPSFRRTAGKRWGRSGIGSSAVGIERFDRVPLLFGTISHVHRLERLSEHLGGAVDIWAKREDCGLKCMAYGGNKVRQARVPRRRRPRARLRHARLDRAGVHSNRTRQVAAVAAARLGLRCVLVQERWVEWPDVVYDKVGNVLLSRIMGADVRLDPSGFDIGIRRSWEDALASVEESGGKPYAIPAGACDRPLGGLGFARWADEVAAQERQTRCLLRHRRRVLRDRIDTRRRGGGSVSPTQETRSCRARYRRFRDRRSKMVEGPGFSPASQGRRPRRWSSDASSTTRR